jgi:hypothetical protein
MEIYKERKKLNNFEIIGIESYIKNFFDCQNDLVFTENAVHFEVNQKYFCAFMLNNYDLFFMESKDHAKNVFYSYNFINENLNLINEDLNIKKDNLELGYFYDEEEYIQNWRTNLTEEQLKDF